MNMPSHTADVSIHGEKASPILNMAKHATSTASKNIIKKIITLLDLYLPRTTYDISYDKVYT